MCICTWGRHKKTIATEQFFLETSTVMEPAKVFLALILRFCTNRLLTLWDSFPAIQIILISFVTTIVVTLHIPHNTMICNVLLFIAFEGSNIFLWSLCLQTLIIRVHRKDRFSEFSKIGVRLTLFTVYNIFYVGGILLLKITFRFLPGVAEGNYESHS